MKELKLLLLEKGDSQKNLVDKANFNFSQIISFEGGPYGKIGPEGKTGNPGSPGPKGSYGPQGSRGNIWTVSDTAPTSPKNGDYWMNPSNNNEIRVYNSATGVWDFYSLNINGLDIFRTYGPLQTQTGASSKSGYFISLPYPIENTMVLSDSYLSNGSSVANPQYSKLVISTDSQNTTRRLLEFTKGAYHGTSFNQETPSFFWETGPTSTYGNYGLKFLTSKSLTFDLGGDFSLKSLSGSVLLKSGDSPSSFTYAIDTYIDGPYNINSSFGGLNINIDSGSGKLIWESSNISLPVPTLSIIGASTTLDIQTSGSTGSQPSLNLKAAFSQRGNLYYKMDEIYPSTRSGSTLFKATNSTTSILEISGKGDFKIDKSIYPLHPLENPGYIQSGSLRYVIFNPTIALNGETDSTSFNVSRGLDFYVVPPPKVMHTNRGICLWTPATGGAFGQNEGWLNLLEDSEFINFRVHSSDPDIGFRFIGINTTSVKNSVPSVAPARVDLGTDATTVEFTIMNISKTASGNGGSNRWFKVLYQAWGGTLNTPICGELYTNGATP